MNKQFLDQESVFRYSRQLIMPEIGMTGQKALLKSSVLVIGAGGLGCPVIQYLTAAGVGCIGIVDYDIVDCSNLHRQVLHTENSVKSNVCKAKSAACTAKSLNSTVNIIEHHVQLSKENAVEIIKNYDVVIDGTDNVPSRYLISDVCVLCNKPLVSGSALRWEGQLTVYHYMPSIESEYGPCYRCLYPMPPPPETVTNCSDGGVLGVVPGIIGTIQALETIKIIIGLGPSYHKKLLIFDGLNCIFRNIKLRGHQHDCAVCGDIPSITIERLPNYEQFCQMNATDKCVKLNILPMDKRVTVSTYKSLFLDSNLSHILIDVRQPIELEICVLPNAINIPIKTFDLIKAHYKKVFEKKNTKMSLKDASLDTLEALIDRIYKENNETVPLIVVCKQGNDSQKAAQILDNCIDFKHKVDIKDLVGGLMNYASKIDHNFLRY